MDEIDYEISDSLSLEDFTIIYKGRKRSDDEKEEAICEIKISRDELIRKLRYFKQKSHELIHNNEIYIHDKFHVDVFQDFINSISTKRIKINSINCYELLELSTKYQYQEILKKTKEFIDNRLDIKFITDQLSSQKVGKEDFDSSKEEIVSKNLDICLKNGYLNRIPLKILIRILNSPNRVIENHQLLFKFVMQKIESADKSDNEIIEILPSCLDYTKMSLDEIDLFIKNEKKSTIFKPQKENEIMKTIYQQLNEIKEKNSIYEKQISELYKMFSEIKQKEKLNEQKMNDMNEHYKQQQIQIEKQKELIQNLQHLNEKYEQQIKEKLEQQENNIIKYKNEIDQKYSSNMNKNQKHETKQQLIENKATIEIPFTNDNPLQGIFNYLNKISNIKDEINVTYSSRENMKDYMCLIRLSDDHFLTENENHTNPWICFEFKKSQIIPTNYTIKSYFSGESGYHPKSWIIEGSKDNIKWENLDEQNNCSFLRGSNIVYSFSIKNDSQEKFKYIKMRLTSPSWGQYADNNRLVISYFELFGKLIT